MTTIIIWIQFVVICLLCSVVAKLWDRSYSLEEAVRKLDPTLYI